MAETTLLSVRPTRLISAGYYFGWIALWILAVVVYVNPSDIVPDWALTAGGLSLKVVLALLLGFLGFVVLLVAEVRRLRIQYQVTDNRIIRKEGILRRRTTEIPFTQIERVELRQGLLQRVFRMGDIVLDTGEDHITFQSLGHVKLVHGELMKHVGMYSGVRMQASTRS